MRRGKRCGNARTRKGKGDGESRGEGELVFVKKKKEYDFEIGRLKVQNLTRYQLKMVGGWDDCLSQKSEEITETVNCEVVSEVVKEEKISTTEEEPFVGVEVSLDLKKSVNTRISLGDDSDDFPYAIQELATGNPDEEEKQIHSNLDLIEKKRLEALKKLNKKRQDRIESNRLMALYRLSMRQSGSAEHDSKSVYLTQEQIKRINQSKTQALQKRHEKMNGGDGSSNSIAGFTKVN